MKRTVTIEGTSRPMKRVSYRRMTRKSRIPRNYFQKNNVHVFQRKASSVLLLNSTNGWTSGAVIGQSLSVNFTLGGINQSISGTPLTLSPLTSGDFTALFDEYQIRSVKLQMFTGFDTSTLSASPNLPVFYLIKDYTDSNALSGLAEALQYENVQVVQGGATPPNNGLKWFIRPKVELQTYRTALTTGYSSKANQWISCDQSDVPHYGLKIWVDPMYAGGNDLGRVLFVYTYTIVCRSTR